jgi:DNA polymerase
MDRAEAPAPRLDLAGSIAAALDWWREAGVDCAFTDEVQPWLEEPEPAVEVKARPIAPPPVAKEPLPPRIGGDPAGWPTDLAQFRQWWLEEPSLDPVAGQRVPPRGEANARLLVLVSMPEEEDGDALLSGRQGQLVAGMARAMGLAPEQLYLASALPRHMPLPDWPALLHNGLDSVLRHHLQLAAPQRLLVLGTDILPLLGHDPAQVSPGAKEIAIGGHSVPMLASYAPGALLEHARLRARLWQQWLDWTDNEDR